MSARVGRAPSAEQGPQNSSSTAKRTWQKILDAAGAVFAARGYRVATVREITELAGANVAAVNYHFGDKEALYAEVLRWAARAAIHDALKSALETSTKPEEALRNAIHTTLQSAIGSARARWALKIATNELADPTPALDKVVDDVVRPNYDRLRATIATIAALPPDSNVARLCAHSIIGQILVYARTGSMLPRLWREWNTLPRRVDLVADHIANFSLAYLRQLRSRRPNKHHSKHTGRKGAR